MRDINDYILFAEVVSGGSFAAASRRVRIPKSTISRRIGLLEERLGVRLIERSTRRFRVTEIGQSFYERCKVIMLDVEQADSIVSESLPLGKNRLVLVFQEIENGFRFMIV